MGTKVQYESSMSGYFSMRDLNEDPNSYNCSGYYGNRAFSNGQYFNGFLSRAPLDAYTSNDLDAVKRTMLKHDAIFKTQVYELHRLYRIQKDLMADITRTELRRNQMTAEVSFSSSNLAFQLGDSSSGARPATSCVGEIGNNEQVGIFFPSQNDGPNGRDLEVLGSRPKKVRRKMFDLQLPAEEYVDSEEGEPFQDEIVVVSNGKVKNELERCVNLNEPVQVEEANHSFCSGGEIRGRDLATNAMPQREFSTNSSNGIVDNSVQNNICFDHNGNGRGILPSFLEPGHNKGDGKFISFNKFQEPQAFHLTDKEHRAKAGSVCSLQFTERSHHEISSNKHPGGPFPASHIISPHPETPTSKPWPQSISSSFEKWSSNSYQKPTVSFHNICQSSSSQSSRIFGDRWQHLSSESRSNPGFKIEAPYQNGFYIGSSSGSKNSTNCSSSHSGIVLNPPFQIREGKQQSEEDCYLTLPWLKPKSATKNEPAANSVRFSNSTELSFINSRSCSNNASLKISELGESQPSISRKLLGFPILEEAVHVEKNESFSQTSPSASLPHPSEGEVEKETRKKIGLLDMNLPCHDDDLVTTKGEGIRHIDLNSSGCISEEEEEQASLRTSAPTYIDLEASPVSEIEEKEDVLKDELMTGAAEAIVAIASSRFPADSVKEEDPLSLFVEVVFSCKDELEKMVNFNPTLRGKDSEEIDYFESMTLALPEVKEDEYMPEPLVPVGLKLEESGTSLLQNQGGRKGQARRGGRQRRDFQRDILPGLASLSRHEVTEDIQTFGGLMRATGYSWNSGSARRNCARNGSGRGRRRVPVINSPPEPVNVTVNCSSSSPLMQKLSKIEIGREDGSLTGWGKTTRRPRRQRCPPAGTNNNNPSAMALA